MVLSHRIRPWALQADLIPPQREVEHEMARLKAKGVSSGDNTVDASQLE